MAGAIGSLNYPLADWQSAGVLVVLSHATRIDQWLKSPLAETTLNLGRSREQALVLRTERAGLGRNVGLVVTRSCF